MGMKSTGLGWNGRTWVEWGGKTLDLDGMAELGWNGDEKHWTWME